MSAPAVPLKRGAVTTTFIDRLDLSGCGLAQLAGQPVLVEGGWPEQTVRVEIVQTARPLPQPRKARARVLEVLAGPLLTPTLPAETCPGAPWLSVAHETQLRWKQQLAELTLDRAVEALEPALRPQLTQARLDVIVPSPAWSGYRNKVEYSCGYGRIERIADPRHPGTDRTMPEGFDPAVGFHRPGTWQTVEPFDHCPILPDFMPAMRRRLDALCRESTAVDNYRPWCDKGCRRAFMLRGGPEFDGVQVLFTLKTGGDAGLREQAAAEALAALDGVPNLSLHLLPVEEGSHPRGHETVLPVAGAPWLTARFCGLQLRVRPTSFFQTNLPAAEQLVRGLQKRMAAEALHTVLDLYCGTGAIGLALAGDGQRVIGIESVPAAIADARENARANGIDSADYTAAATEKALAETLAGPVADAVAKSLAVVDPPRAGMHPKALKTLCRSPLPRLAYVACNPAALAQDLPHLARAGFRLESLTPYDFFPHTPHLEILAILQR